MKKKLLSNAHPRRTPAPDCNQCGISFWAAKRGWCERRLASNYSCHKAFLAMSVLEPLAWEAWDREVRAENADTDRAKAADARNKILEQEAAHGRGDRLRGIERQHPGPPDLRAWQRSMANLAAGREIRRRRHKRKES